MTVLYVAMSKNLAGWAADVGLTKHVYKIGTAECSADDAIKALNDDGLAGEGDWRLLKQQEGGGLEEAVAIERLAKKEKIVDPNYYPKIRGAIGIFRVVRPIGHLTVMSPPLIMTRSRIDDLISILRESISVTADELTREGYRLD